MIKVAWLCPYNINNLLPEIIINRNIQTHSVSWIQNLSESLSSSKEIELHIISHSQLVEKTQYIIKNQLHFHIIKYNFPFTKRGFPWFLPYDKLTGFYAFRKKAQKIILEINPDVLHVHGTEGCYYSPASHTKIPYILSIQGIISEYVKVNPSISGYLQIPFEIAAVKKAKYFGCRTAFDYAFVQKKKRNAKIFDLPEAINSAFFDQQWDPPVLPTILFVGSLNKRKGVEDLIRALKQVSFQFPNIQLKLIGSGSHLYVTYLHKLIAKLTLEKNIYLLGAQSTETIARELSKATLFVLPTLIDNSPNCLAEAMAVGVPSIASDVGGIPSMIENGVNGILFKKRDVSDLANQALKLLTNKALQNKLSINAKMRARERNFPSSVATRYLDVYKYISQPIK